MSAMQWERPSVVVVQSHIAGPLGTGLFVEIREATSRTLIASFDSTKVAARWLGDQGYRWVTGSSGLWSK